MEEKYEIHWSSKNYNKNFILHEFISLFKNYILYQSGFSFTELQ